MNGTDRPLSASGRGSAASQRPSSGLVFSHISAQRASREITLEVGQRDIRIRRSFKTSVPSSYEHKRGIRKSITMFSDGSRRRLLFTARNLPGLEIMLTLTYPSDYPADGHLVKDHWRRFRQWMVRNGASYGLWVLEFQKRGAPHFHIFLNKQLDRHAVSKAWYRIVGSEDSKHLVAGTKIEEFRYPPALGSYVMKYAAKMEQKEVPADYQNVGRFWGTWGRIRSCKTIVLPQAIGKHFVRVIRKAHIKARKSWKFRRRFRDNGKSGYVAWDSAQVVRRVLDDFIEDGVMFPR